MGKDKLKRFAENKTFSNVIEVRYDEVLNRDFRLKGKWNTFFGNSNPLTIELGCGKGEYTVALARMFPGRNFVGMDVKGARFWRGAKTALEENMNNVCFVRSHINFVPSFFDTTDKVEEIWITFPDPQPRESKESKRLTSARALERYRMFALPNAIVNLKTDSVSLYDYTLDEVVLLQGLEIMAQSRNIDQDFPGDEVLGIQTFYEKMWRGQGKPIHYLRFNLFPK